MIGRDVQWRLENSLATIERQLLCIQEGNMLFLGQSVVARQLASVAIGLTNRRCWQRRMPWWRKMLWRCVLLKLYAAEKKVAGREMFGERRWVLEGGSVQEREVGNTL